MIPGFKIENDKLTLDLYEILKYPKLAKIYKDDISEEKEYAYKIFLYISHIADKKGYCRSKGLSAKEAHIWALRNSGLNKNYIPSKEIKEAITFIKDEFDSHPVEDAIETNISGIRSSLTLISMITEDLKNAIIDNNENTDIDTLLSYEESIKRMAKYSAELPKRIDVLSELKKEWDDIEKGTSVIRGGKTYKNSYDGNDDVPVTDSGEDGILE